MLKLNLISRLSCQEERQRAISKMHMLSFKGEASVFFYEDRDISS